MPLLQGGMGSFTPYSYFPRGTRYGEAERWMAPPAAPAVAPTPAGLPATVTDLMSTAKKVTDPAVEKVSELAKSKGGPLWIVGGLVGLYLLARR